MEFTANERKIAIEVLLNIALGSKAGCFAIEARANRAFLKSTSAITFTNEEMEVKYLDHKRPLYLAASINQILIKRAFVDMGALVKLVPTCTLEGAGISKSKIQGFPIDVMGLGGRGVYGTYSYG